MAITISHRTKNPGAGRPKLKKDTYKRPSKSRLREPTDPERDQLMNRIEGTAEISDEALEERVDNLAEKASSMGLTRVAFSAERMMLAYRLSIRGTPESEIAKKMGLSLKQVSSLLAKVTAKLRLDPKTLNVGYYMGESLAFYQEIRILAMSVVADAKSKKDKLAAMQVALRAEDNKNNFLTKIGVYSPTVVERIERWIVGTAEEMIAPQRATDSTRTNLAAAIGRALMERRPDQEFRGAEDVEFVEDHTTDPQSIADDSEHDSEHDIIDVDATIKHTRT